jgi:hypothetical protein
MCVYVWKGGGGLLPILQQCERMLTDAKHYLQPSNSKVKENILVDSSFHVAFGKQNSRLRTSSKLVEKIVFLYLFRMLRFR